MHNSFTIHNEFKILVLGDVGVGKTSLINNCKRYCSKSSLDRMEDDNLHYLKYKNCNLLMTDTNGFKKDISSYQIDQFEIVLLLFDSNNKISFKNIFKVWLAQLKIDINKIIVIATKIKRGDNVIKINQDCVKQVESKNISLCFGLSSEYNNLDLLLDEIVRRCLG